MADNIKDFAKTDTETTSNSENLSGNTPVKLLHAAETRDGQVTRVFSFAASSAQDIAASSVMVAAAREVLLCRWGDLMSPNHSSLFEEIAREVVEDALLAALGLTPRFSEI